MSNIDTADFAFIRDLVRTRSAIVLDHTKTYLAESRLQPLVQSEGFGSISDLVLRLRAERFGKLHRRVVEAMTTNETSFFRDVLPFDALRTDILPALVRARAATRAFSIWCAACSCGQEPYSIALVIREYFPELGGWDIRLTATDINTEVLARAARAEFTQLEVNRGLPAPLLVKYFSRHGLVWTLDESVRSLVRFHQINLADPWALAGPIDLIFMRNVLIYFDIETKRSILARARRLLRPDGYLFLGAAETTHNLSDDLERAPIGRTWAYRPKGAPR